MKRKIAFVIYRDWAFSIHKEICKQYEDSEEVDFPLIITTKECEFNFPEGVTVKVVDGADCDAILNLLKSHSIETALFYGWSWMVSDSILNYCTCLCLHPSPLPKYRGGSPLQNQIVANEKNSAVSVIKMNSGIDDGDVYMQLSFSLYGSLDKIFNRMSDLGTVITHQFVEDFINNVVVFTPQNDLLQNPPHKRRKPADGRIDISKLVTTEYIDIYNLVRCLSNPYPNAYFETKEGVVYVQEVKFRKVLPENYIRVSFESSRDFFIQNKPIALEIVDGFAVVVSYTFVINKST